MNNKISCHQTDIQLIDDINRSKFCLNRTKLKCSRKGRLVFVITLENELF